MMRATLAVPAVKVKAVCDRVYRHGLIAKPDFGHDYDERAPVTSNRHSRIHESYCSPCGRGVSEGIALFTPFQTIETFVLSQRTAVSSTCCSSQPAYKVNLLLLTCSSISHSPYNDIQTLKTN